MKNYDPEVLKTAQLEMIKQYRAGNAEALSAEGITMTQERNEIWLPVLSESLSKQNTFIAVGAGHLFGPHGLVELLRNSGFNVEPDGE